MKKAFIKIFCAVLAALMLAVSLGTAGCGGDEGENGAEVKLKVGLMSDPHFISTNNWGGNNSKAFAYFREQGVDAIVIAGDMVDKAFAANYQAYTSTLEQVFGADKPQMFLTMGNHDFWKVHSVSSDKTEMYNLFESGTGLAPNRHAEVNGYHFLSVAPDSGNLEYKSNIEWLKTEVAAAASAAPEKPIFVVAHDNAADTTPSASSADLKKALAAYPQVVLFSGHTHYACQDERNIFQGDFTSVDLGSTAYSTIEEGNYLNRPSTTGQANVFVRIMTVTENNIEIKRVNVIDGEQEKQAYNLSLPLSKETFTYTAARAESAIAPVFAADAAITAVAGSAAGSVNISFPSASCESDMVYGYRVRVANVDKETDKQNVYVATDFYKGVKRIAAENSVTVKNLTKGATYEITVTARESFLKWSEPLTVRYTAE